MGQVFQLVQHFGKRWELVALEGFVTGLPAGDRVIDAVDVFVGVAVKVVVLEQQVAAGNSANVAEPIATQVHPSDVVVGSFKAVGCFQNHRLLALNETVQAQDALEFRLLKGESIREPGDKGMLG